MHDSVLVKESYVVPREHDQDQECIADYVNAIDKCPDIARVHLALAPSLETFLRLSQLLLLLRGTRVMDNRMSLRRVLVLHNNLLGCEGRGYGVVIHVDGRHNNLLRIGLSLNDDEIIIGDLRLLLNWQLMSLLHVVGLHLLHLRIRISYWLLIDDGRPIASI